MKSKSITVRGSDAKVLGWIFRGGCVNAACKRHVKNGKSWHAITRYNFLDDQHVALQIAFVRNNHFATRAAAEQAVVAFAASLKKETEQCCS